MLESYKCFIGILSPLHLQESASGGPKEKIFDYIGLQRVGRSGYLLFAEFSLRSLPEFNTGFDKPLKGTIFGRLLSSCYDIAALDLHRDRQM